MLYQFILLIFLPSFSLQSLEILDISDIDFKTYVRDKQWKQPACVLSCVKDSQYRKIIDKVLAEESWILDQINFMKKTMSDDIDGMKKATVECYVGRSQPQIYIFDDKKKRKKRFKSWIKSLMLDFPSPINMLSNTSIESVTIINQVILAVPGAKHFKKVENIFLKLADQNTNITYYMVPPNTDQERSLFNEGKVTSLPTVFLYKKKEPQQKLMIVKELIGEFEVNEDFIRLHLVLYQLKSFYITADQLKMYMTSSHYLKRPLILCIFSSHSPTSYQMLHAIYRATTAQSDPKKFVVALVDTSHHEMSLVLARYLKVNDLVSLPTTLCIYRQRVKGKMEIKHSVLKKNVAPTYLSLISFLQSLELDAAPPKIPTRWHNHIICSVQNSTHCVLGDKLLVFERKSDKKKNKKKIKNSKIRNKSTWLTLARWKRLFSLESSSVFDVLDNKQSFQEKTYLVVYLHPDCSYCSIVLPEFQKVVKAAYFIENVSVFFMNCSQYSEICKQESVTGYPTLVLYRTVKSNLKESCLPQSLLNTVTRVDYHGEMEATPILKWISKSTLPTMVMLNKDKKIPSNEKNILLVANMYSESYAKQYLPVKLQEKLYPATCVLLLCKLLYSNVDCHGKLEDEQRMSYNERLFVLALDFHRSDGINITLFETGYLLSRTLQHHKMHHVAVAPINEHHYDADFTCEDDHKRCSRTLYTFIVDHLRTPLTYIDTGILHSHRWLDKELRKKPILMAIAHRENITSGSNFYKDLETFALNYYRQVNTVLLDAKRHAHWAHSFVPKGYHNKEQVMMKFYPRFVMLSLDDHRHAAFYPPVNAKQSYVKDRLNLTGLHYFVKHYLSNKEELIVETERF